MNKNLPNPGSKEAINKGCKCPVIDNHYGEGFVIDGERVWIFSQDCVLHSNEN